MHENQATLPVLKATRTRRTSIAIAVMVRLGLLLRPEVGDPAPIDTFWTHLTPRNHFCVNYI